MSKSSLEENQGFLRNVEDIFVAQGSFGSVQESLAFLETISSEKDEDGLPSLFKDASKALRNVMRSVFEDVDQEFDEFEGKVIIGLVRHAFFDALVVKFGGNLEEEFWRDERSRILYPKMMEKSDV